MKVLGEVGLHAALLSASSRVSDRASVKPFVLAVAVAALVATAALGAQLLAGWPMGFTVVVLLFVNLGRHDLGWKTLAALLDDAVALDEHMRLDVSSVGDL